MTREEFEVKARDLAENYRECLVERMLQYYDSGALDTSSYDNNYILPRITMAAALKAQAAEEIAMGVSTRGPAFSRKVANLAHF